MAEEAKGAVETGTTGATGTTGTEETKGTQATETKAQETQTQQQMTAEEINKLIQSGIDKHTSELGKKIANLQKENETLKKEKMTADELKEFEMSERQKALDEQQKQITEQANRLYAIKAANAAGIDLGKDLERIDLIMGENEEVINAKVKAVKAMIDTLVAEKVAQTFKTNGREPNGSKATTEVKGSIAEKLGQTRAEQQKKSNDVLSHYLGGK